MSVQSKQIQASTAPTTIPVFFNEKQVHDPVAYSKSPLKPGLLARRIAKDAAFEIQSDFGPVTRDEMMLVHTRAYVDGLLDGVVPDGFGNKSTKDFEAIRMTAGNMVAAVGAVLEGAPVVWSLTSGFHHANPDHGSGFCTIEALSLSAVRHEARVLIVDEDAHFGDGCMAIGAPNVEYMQSGHTHTKRYVNLDAYRKHLHLVIAEFKPEVIIYQAGADNWVGDPLGGCLTMQELYQRDIITLFEAKRAGIGIVVNLAGGYAENYDDTLTIHMNTGEAIKEVYFGYGAAMIPVHVVEQEEAK
jgi:acetoin utilization deacetylase AcuC-like enzyme